MQDSIIKTEWLTSNTDRMCGCCRKQAIVEIKIGKDFGTFSQTTSVPMCNDHMKQLKEQLK